MILPAKSAGQITEAEYPLSDEVNVEGSADRGPHRQDGCVPICRISSPGERGAVGARFRRMVNFPA